MLLMAAADAGAANSAAPTLLRVQVVDAISREPLLGAVVYVEDLQGSRPRQTLITGFVTPRPTPPFDFGSWRVANAPGSANAGGGAQPLVLSLAAGTSVTLHGTALDGQVGTAGQQPPVRDIYIRVTATRIRLGGGTTPQTTVTQKERQTFTNVTGGGSNTLLQGPGNAGVASDSAGQQHVRGEHAEIAFVVDGVPLPDTLSGRQGSIVVPETVDRLNIITGGFAPEFGGQTAAILDITTVPGARHPHSDLSLQAGSYATTNGDITAVGPLGSRANYVVDVNGHRTSNYVEPQQPDDQTAHNTGSDQSYFAKLRYNPSRRDTLTATMSHAPSTLQINNRTGLPESYADVGQGFGFLGLRNANGVRPDVTADNAGLLGAQPMLLQSQQAAGMDIDQREVNEFAILNWRRQIALHDVGQFSMTVLHSGQDLTNHSPAVNLANLPVDNSIEYNPTVSRDVHHVQYAGSYSAVRGAHELKAGFLLDDQSGDEAYLIQPASRLALDELAALDPALAPPGAAEMAGGRPVLDVNGNPVFDPTGAQTTLRVHRSGFYRAAYLQDTWTVSKRFAANYGLRLDWYHQTENTGQVPVDSADVSPRLNFSYMVNGRTTLRWSFDRLFNVPPLAQGAVVGAPIQPEVLNQYDVSLERHVGRGQDARVAYYYKQIHNQVDTGLLIPGSEIGLFSAVNFEFGGVHGLEFSYDITPPNNVGWDGYFNYTYSVARPNGVDNSGTPVPDFNDHDQRQTLGVGAAYDFKGGATAAITLNYGSGLASSIVTPNGPRTPRTSVDLLLNSGQRWFGRRWAVALDVENLLDDRSVINFQSGFSGTRFQQGRRILASLNGRF